MKEIVIATGNLHKVQEFRSMLEPLGYQVKSLKDFEETVEIIENGTTFEENALIKARTIQEAFHIDVIADDSGLAIDALDGAPGVYSARFMGEDTDYRIKNQALIDQLENCDCRNAQFVCAIAYVSCDGEERVFRGEVHGEITKEIIGEHGFGYDPIFYYPPYRTTLANVSEEEKNKVSHRGRALRQFISYLKQKEKTLHLVLFEPEIPQNTGNMMRTCMATNTKLHLIEPLGFSLDERHLKRAGMDYIADVDFTVYPNWEAFVQTNPSDNYYYMTRYGQKAPSAFDFASLDGDIYFILGKESTGIPKEILSQQLEHCMRLPMVKDARSLNLSNCAAIILYEALRQLNYPNLSGVECIKGKDWLLK